MRFYFIVFICALIWLFFDKDIDIEINKMKVKPKEDPFIYILAAVIITLIFGLPIGGILYLFS